MIDNDNKRLFAAIKRGALAYIERQTAIRMSAPYATQKRLTAELESIQEYWTPDAIEAAHLLGEFNLLRRTIKSQKYPMDAYQTKRLSYLHVQYIESFAFIDIADIGEKSSTEIALVS